LGQLAKGAAAEAFRPGALPEIPVRAEGAALWSFRQQIGNCFQIVINCFPYIVDFLLVLRYYIH
ncbi:MAG: hypothetical protein II697_03110, partial [Clostridia bacterium]|nr:hypothetical protein [Clostridia bacterium]